MPPITPTASLFLALGVLAAAAPAAAQIAISANDNKLVQVDGVNQVVRNPAPDNLTVIDLSVFPPRVVAEVEGVPTSVIGPPLSVALTPDEGLALVTAAMKIDPADPTRQAADNRLSVVDLKASPPRVISTLLTGAMPSGVSINRKGTLALVSNRGDGSVSVFRIRGREVTGVGQLQVGNAASTLGHVAITPDGKRALLTRDGDNLVTVLAIDGERVTLAGHDIRTGFRPYAVEITPDGNFAVVGNVGYGTGDTDTVSLVDLRSDSPHAVDAVAVGQTPEGIRLSPDGRLCAVIVQNGSNKPRASPFHSDHGKLVLLRVEGGRLIPAAEAPIGHWPQGAAFSSDGRTILAGNMVERNVQVFRWDGATLADTGQVIAVKGGSAAMRTAGP